VATLKPTATIAIGATNLHPIQPRG